MFLRLTHITTMLSLVLLLISCKDEGSIQTYIVDHQELPNFTVIDVSPKMLDVERLNFSENERQTYNSLKKINFLGYRIKDNNLKAFNEELQAVENIFKTDKYETLMTFNTNGIKFIINTVRANSTVDEILILASTEQKGFGVVRVLGDNMKPENMMALINKFDKTNVSKNQLKSIIDFFE